MSFGVCCLLFDVCRECSMYVVRCSLFVVVVGWLWVVACCLVFDDWLLLCVVLCVMCFLFVDSNC